MIDILDAKDDFYLCSKPEGMDFHNDQGELGFFTTLQKQCGDEKLYPIHRLDKGTSGLILVGRTKEGTKELNTLFDKSQPGLEKYYIALSDHKAKKKQGSIKGDMERSRRSSWILTRSLDNPAISSFFSKPRGDEKLRYFLFRIYTGKTHQIRVAMKSIGAPVLGDTLYSGTKSDRLYLHSYAIRFPWKGEDYRFLYPPRDGELFEDDRYPLPEEWRFPEDLPWPRP